MPRIRTRLLTLASSVVLGGVVSLALVAPAEAAQGSIDHVESHAGAVQVLYSLPGAGAGSPDLSTLAVSFEGKQLPSTATLASQAHDSIRRTAVLAIDVSDSMGANGKFQAAKRAARAFLASAPADLYVGIVTFAGGVHVAQTPTLDRAASRQVIGGLTLSRGTELYDGVRQAVAAGGTTGQREVVVLSDGHDTSGTPLSAVTGAVRKSAVKVDVVALAQSATDEAKLRQISDASGGVEIKTADPAALSKVFSAEAETLARQILIRSKLPAGDSATEGTLAVSVHAGGQTYDDSAFVTVHPRPATPVREAADALVAGQPGGPHVPAMWFYLGLLALGLGALVLVVGAFGVLEGRKSESIEDRVNAYTRAGASQRSKRAALANQQGVTAQAVGIATKALQGNEGLEATLGAKLEAAGLSMKPAEWLLLHASIAFATGVVALLLFSGSVLGCLAGLILGAVAPWLYLSLQEGRRLRAFNAQLPETLQLMSGSLSAGLSLAQSVDTVVREGSEPMAGEFRRALVETRLGVEMEDALDGIATRMKSVDFEWVVMAIRIQREVGGNLAELLNNVSATIREREYLYRQVQALSAEGRLSVWILGILPPAFVGYLVMVNPTYLHPLVSTFLGWCMVVTMVVLIVVGIFWMKKLVKIEV